MYLDSHGFDVKLINDSEGNSFEMWWILDEKEILMLSRCPENSPTTVIHTMKIKDSVKELSTLIDTGWEFVECSSDFLKHCNKRLISKLRAQIAYDPKSIR
jgi:hypothetical protein